MNKLHSKLWQIILATLIVLIVGGAGFVVGYWARDHQTFSVNASNYPIFEQAYRLLLTHGFYPLPEQNKIEYGMIRGLLQAYNDPYTSFVEPPQHELQTQQLQGKFGGIGARIQRDEQNQFRLYPFPDSPAKRTGVLDGDILLQIDEVQITSQTPHDDVLALLRGEKGTSVTIIIYREDDQKEYTFQITREEISLPSVTWNKLLENELVGHIQVNLMSATTADEVKNAVADLISQGVQSIILDLRNNSGGLVDSGVKIAGLFLPADSAILRQQYRDKPPQLIKTNEDGVFRDIPMVVLINNGTASAAEITAGALKANHRATIVGVPSFGKYTIQLVFDLSDGSSLHVTAAEWEIPGLQPPVRDHGVIPDIWIEGEDTENIDNRFVTAALEALHLMPQP